MILVQFLENYEPINQSLLFQTALKCCRLYKYNQIKPKVKKTKYHYFILEVAKAIKLNLNASISIFTFNWNVDSKYTVLLA